MSSPSRFTSGVTNAKPADPFSQFIMPDPTSAHVYVEDFDYYLAADWAVTEVGVATQTLTDGDGGRLGIVNAAANDDSSFSQKVGENFLFQTGKKLWFECLFEVNEPIEMDMVMGLQITDTTPLDASDGVYFTSADGSADIDLVVVKGSTSTVESSIATLSVVTPIRLSYFYDGVSEIQYFVDGVHSGTVATTNLPDDEVLTISYGIQNGEAAPKTMLIDYIMAAKER